MSQCLPLQPSEMGDTHGHFIMPVAQHPDLNPVNYKIRVEMQQPICLINVRIVRGLTLSHGFQLRVINKASYTTD